MSVRNFLPALAAGLLLAASVKAAPTADDRIRATVDERVTEWWLKPAEKRFDEIGWAADILTARQLTAQRDRPLFLFTMDGRVNTGRC